MASTNLVALTEFKDVRRGVPDWALEVLSADSRSCINHLLDYRASPMKDLGNVRQAAVLVILFEEPGDNKLSVVLTTRAQSLRRHPNETALPGGKVDLDDPTIVYTARREAFEEIRLPMVDPNIHHLAVLDPVITILPLNAHVRNHIILSPVICLVSDHRIVQALRPNPEEVDAIFTHPLRGCLDGRVSGRDEKRLVDKGGKWWPHEEEFHSFEDRIGATGPYKMHRFRTAHSPIKGITSDVLIETAIVAYSAQPLFPRYAPSQAPFSTIIAQVVLDLSKVASDKVGRAIEEENKPLEWGTCNSETRILSGETWHDRA